MDKYEWIEYDPTGKSDLYQIIALRDIPEWGVKAGETGGLVSSEYNLSQTGNAWIGKDAIVCENAQVTGGYVGGESFVSGWVKVKDGVITDSNLSGRTIIDEDVTILNSKIVNGDFSGKGNIVDSDLENVFLCDKYVLNNAQVKAINQLVGFEKQIWSNVNLSLNDGKVEQDLELRDVEMDMNSFNTFQKVEMEYLTVHNKNLFLTIGDSDISTRKMAVLKGMNDQERIHISSEHLTVISSTMEGNISIDGTMVKMVDSTIHDYASITFGDSGGLYNVKMTEFARIDIPVGKGYKSLRNVVLDGEVIYNG